MYGQQQNGGADSGLGDPEEYFKQQFGGDKFVDIIGEISIAKDFKDAMTMMAKEGDPEGAKAEIMGQEDRTEIRLARISTLEAKLIEKLSLYTDAFPYPDSNVESRGNPVGTSFEQLASEAIDSFRAFVSLEADQLRLESYGVELLHAIGFTYSLKASLHASKIDAEEGPVFKRAMGFGSRWVGLMREKAHIVGETVGTFKTAIDLQTSFAKLQEMEKKKEQKKKEADVVADSLGGSTDEANGGRRKDATSPDDDSAYEITPEERELRQKLEFEAASKGLEALWRGSKLEVESVLREVCDRVLGDEKIGKEVRKRRIEALRVLGSVYESVKNVEGSGGGKMPMPGMTGAAAAS
ncbi:hypothetical protein HDU67_004596 [Dinochytrium kinnereticum]|nr:hypothetical protein HDU67_004596 [Dinochytrium kinnereticum]